MHRMCSTQVASAAYYSTTQMYRVHCIIVGWIFVNKMSGMPFFKNYLKKYVSKWVWRYIWVVPYIASVLCKMWLHDKWLGLRKSVLSPMLADLIFHHEQISCYTYVICFCWLLFWNTVAMCASSLLSKWRLGQSWDGCEWLHSCVVLNNGVCCNFPSF